MTRVKLVLAALITLAVIACGSSPPTRYYRLEATAVRSPALDAIGHGVVRIEAVTIPPELNRLEIVTRSGPNRVHVTGADRWAAPLDVQIRRVLSQDLSRRLPPNSVADPDEPAGGTPRRQLWVGVVEYVADARCAITLRANWTLREADDTGRRGSEDLNLSAQPVCQPAAAMSEALGLLADRLAAEIVQP